MQELAAAAADNSTELMGLELQALLTLAAHLLPARQLASLDANSSSKLATPQLQRALQCLAELLKILGQHNAYSAAEGMPQLVSKVQLRLSLFIRACYSTLNNSQLQPAQVSPMPYRRAHLHTHSAVFSLCRHAAQSPVP